MPGSNAAQFCDRLTAFSVSPVEVPLNTPAQLSLPLYLPDDETFASFWPGDNPSLLAAVQNVLRQDHSGYIYFWSREGAGRSHLLHAACAELSARGDAVGYVPLDKRTWFVPEVLDGMEQLSLVCIDNIECIAGDEEWEMAIDPDMPLPSKVNLISYLYVQIDRKL